MRLKEIYSNITQDKEKLSEENKQLKSLLHQNNIPPVSAGGALDELSSNLSFGYASSNVSGAHAPGSNHAFTPPLTGVSSIPTLSHPSRLMGGNAQMQGTSSQQLSPLRIDYDQAGIDFVLTYDDPDDPSKAYMSPPHF